MFRKFAANLQQMFQRMQVSDDKREFQHQAMQQSVAAIGGRVDDLSTKIDTVAGSVVGVKN